MSIPKQAMFAPDKLFRFITESLTIRPRINRPTELIQQHDLDFTRLIEKICRQQVMLKDEHSAAETYDENKYEHEMFQLLIAANEDLGYLVDSYCESWSLHDVKELSEILIAISIRAHIMNGEQNPMVLLHSELINLRRRIIRCEHRNQGIANQISVSPHVTSWVYLIALGWMNHSCYVMYPVYDETVPRVTPHDQYTSAYSFGAQQEGGLWDLDSMYGRLHMELLEFLIKETNVVRWSY